MCIKTEVREVAKDGGYSKRCWTRFARNATRQAMWDGLIKTSCCHGNIKDSRFSNSSTP